MGENPSDLMEVSGGYSVAHGSGYPERQQIDAKRRLLDLVSDYELQNYLCTLFSFSENFLVSPDVNPTDYQVVHVARTAIWNRQVNDTAS